MQHSPQHDKRADQMDPHPDAEDVSLQPLTQGHGTAINYHQARRGIEVSVKLLRARGISLTKRERAAAQPIAGELIMGRVHDRTLDYHAYAEVVVFDRYQYPSRQAILLNPEIFAADERGLILYGIEKRQVPDGGYAAYWQTWQVIFGTPAPEPPP